MFTGGQRKKEAEKTMGMARGLREDIGKFRGQVEGVRTAPRPDVDYLRGKFRGMAEDVNQRGFDAATVAKMKGAAAEPISGARTSMQRALQRSIAASGTGGTGAYNRAIMQTTPKFTEALRSSMRDIDIANAQAQREDLWKSLGGIGDIQAAEDKWNLQNLGLESSTFGDQIATFGPEMAAQKEAYKSVWGPFFQDIIGKAVGGFGYGLGASAGGGGGYSKSNPTKYA